MGLGFRFFSGDRDIPLVFDGWLSIALLAAALACLNIADDRLPAGLHVDVLHGHLSLALAAVLVQGFKLFRIEHHQLLCVLKRHVAPREGLVGKSGAFKTFERRIMGSNHLHSQHTLGAIGRLQAFVEFQGPYDTLMFRLFACILVNPKKLGDFIDLLL